MKKIRGRIEIPSDSLGAYIYRLYFPKKFRKVMSIYDLDAIINSDLLEQPNIDDNEYAIYYAKIDALRILTKEEIERVLTAYRKYSRAYRSKLRPADVDMLRSLNKRLSVVEKKLVKECTRIKKKIKGKRPGKDFTDDYEIDVGLSCYLKESDPCYDEDEIFDNCIYKTSFIPGVNLKTDDLSALLSRDFNNVPIRHPLSDERHCSLFHCLNEYSPMPFKDLARIGNI